MYSTFIFVLAGTLLLLLVFVAMPYIIARGIVAVSSSGGQASRPKRVARILLGGLLMALAGAVAWDAAFPSDKSAMSGGHFVEVAQRPLPASARNVYQDENIHNIRGRSWVRAHFEVSPADYAALLASISKAV